MPDPDGGGTANDTSPDDSGSTYDSSAQDAKLRAARDDAAKHRIKAREATETLETMQADMAGMKATQAAILKAAGIDSDGTDPASDPIKAIEAKAAKQTSEAKNALRRADFKAEALKAGIDPGQVDDAYELAAVRGYLDSVDVDLGTAQVAGTEDAAAKFAEENPIYRATAQPKPGTDSRPPGSPAGQGVDLKNIKPGDIRNMSDEEFAAMAADGIVLRDQARGINWKFDLGGDASTRDITRAKANWDKYFKPPGLD